jgi:tetratricopeptide (TPR) repeat protein
MGFAFLLVLFAGSAQAQITGGINETTSSNWGGTAFIAGTVLLPDGTPSNQRIPIKLRSMVKGEIIGSTDDNGRFVFSRISNGVYVVSIEGFDQYDSYSQEFEILEQRTSLPQTTTLTVRLRFKPSFDLKPAVVDSQIAGAPQKARKLYDEALKLAGEKKHQAAIDKLKLAVSEYADFVSAFNEMAVQYMQLGDLEKADESLKAALKISPEASEPLINRGIVLFRMKKFSESEDVFRSALDVNANSPVAHYYLGRLLTNSGKFDEAEKELKSALQLSNDQMIEAHRMLANLFITKGDDKNAIASLETYLRLNPNAPDADKLRAAIEQLKKAPQTPN